MRVHHAHRTVVRPVHVYREKDGRLPRCRPRRRGQVCAHGNRLSCGKRHTRDDNQLGEPLCPDCYDYTGAVLFNACAPELWRRFTITLRRSLARQAGLTNKALAAQVRISFAKVAEYQRRGVVHFHAIIRLDGPTGPITAPPGWATVALLTDAIAQAARSVNLQTPAAPGLPTRTLAWGRELDTHPVTATAELTDSKVAAYVAKYATKAAECTGTLDRRITPTDQLNLLPIREHARRHIAECIRLGKLPGLEHLRLIAWAHMLGFAGHFATKSRAYSTTLSALRAERTAYQREQAIAAGLVPDVDDDTGIVVTDWHFVGREYPPSLPLTGGAA
jgi:Replication initiator protein, pSAM2